MAGRVLTVSAAVLPDPTDGEVRVRMTGLALNRAKALFRDGDYLFGANFPTRIGNEGVGVIEAVVDDVRGFEVSQRVNTLAPDNESTHGYAADYNNVSQDKLLPAPDGLTDRQAATARIPFLTTYHHFVEIKHAADGR